MTRTEVKQLQRGLNRFTHKRLRGVGPLLVDGVMGRSTKSRIRMVKYYLGYKGKLNSRADHDFRSRLWHPNSIRYSSLARVRRGRKRRVSQRKKARANARSASASHGVSTYDGRPVATWLVPYLKWARAHEWRGTLNSGWRDPKYSQSLCFRMCGRPSCPGKCAGLSSNHVGSVRPRGAVDVSDYVRFGQLMQRCPLQPRVFNALGARDPVHFSASGN